MGLYQILCRTCNSPTMWYSSDRDQRCSDCKSKSELKKVDLTDKEPPIDALEERAVEWADKNCDCQPSDDVSECVATWLKDGYVSGALAEREFILALLRGDDAKEEYLSYGPTPKSWARWLEAKLKEDQSK